MKAVLGFVDDSAPGSVENSVCNFYVSSNRETVKKHPVVRRSLHVVWRNPPIGVLPNHIWPDCARTCWSPRFRVNGTRTIQGRVLIVKDGDGAATRCGIILSLANYLRVQLETLW